MKIKGIKRGKNIEISEEMNIPDGQELVIEITKEQLMKNKERHLQLDEVW
ncbi:MAG: hypothetical protein PUP92_35005 [Rhizonema sp. PD38]|nr:hypothetical protein [Rhizonema sp. PD38]